MRERSEPDLPLASRIREAGHCDWESHPRHAEHFALLEKKE